MDKTTAINRKALWPMVGHLAGVLGQFGLLKIVAVFWGVESFGQFSLVLAVSAAVNILVFGPFGQWVIRDYQAAKEARYLNEYFSTLSRTALLGILTILIFAGLISYIVEGYFQENIGIGWELIILGALFGIGYSLNNILYSLLYAANFPSISAGVTFVDAFLKVTIALVLGWLGFDDLRIVVALLVIPQLGILTLVSFIFIKQQENGAEWLSQQNSSVLDNIRSNMIDYAKPFLIWGVFGYMASMGDKWILANNVSQEELGIYSAMAFASIGLTNALFTAISKGLIPIVFKISGSGQSKERTESAANFVNIMALWLAVIFSFLILVSYFFPDQIITLLASSEFTSQSYLLWILMTAAIIFNMTQFYMIHGLIDRKPGIYLPGKIFHGVFILSGLILFVSTYGLEAAVYVILFGNIINLLSVLFVNKVSRETDSEQSLKKL